jgi:hypothetical protein
MRSFQNGDAIEQQESIPNILGPSQLVGSFRREESSCLIVEGKELIAYGFWQEPREEGI